MKYEFCELADVDLERLIVILGGSENVLMAEDYWHAHDISAILASQQTVGAQPFLLVHQYDGYFTIRLFSPSKTLVEDSVKVMALRRMSEIFGPPE